MNIQSSEATSFGNGLIIQRFPTFVIYPFDMKSPFSRIPSDEIYRDVSYREQGTHRGKPFIDKKFIDMLNGLFCIQTEVFMINSFFTFSQSFKLAHPDVSLCEMFVHIQMNNLGYDFFTPEEAHLIAGQITQEDSFCKRDQPVVIFYKFSGSPRIFCIWIFRDKKNHLKIYDLDYYVTGYVVPSSVIILTKDNMLIPENRISEE